MLCADVCRKLLFCVLENVVGYAVFVKTFVDVVSPAAIATAPAVYDIGAASVKVLDHLSLGH